MNKMMKRAAVALVLAMVAFGPTAAIAAPHSNPYLSSASGAKFGIIDVLMQILGIGSRTPILHDVKPAAPTSGTTVAPRPGGTTYSTDGAIWGGGRCGVGGC